MQKYTLLELNEFIRRVITLNLPDELWINCEISQAGRSRGQMYLELIQKDEISNQVVSQSKAILWARDYASLRKIKGEVIDDILKSGQSVLLKVKVEYSERYGLTLMIKDIDTAFTLGALALKRQQTIEELMKLGLVGKNKTHELPIIIQRIAIISSETAAGYQDFINQLHKNENGYQFTTSLFQAAMQGEKTADDVTDALRLISSKSDDFDIVIIIRGGGAKLDLASFDHFNICKSIANTSLPVLVGIGHEIDETIADMVAHTSLKTPTAVADFIIHYNQNAEIQVELMYQNILDLVRFQHQKAELQLQQLEFQQTSIATNILKDAQRTLEYIELELPKSTQVFFKKEQLKLEAIEKNIELLSPTHILKRGFTLTLKDGKIVKSVSDLNNGDTIQTIFKDGETTSIITES